MTIPLRKELPFVNYISTPAILFLIFFGPQRALATPHALKENISVREIGKVPSRTMRIAKNPNTNKLYILTTSGNIFELNTPKPKKSERPLIVRGKPNNEGDINWEKYKF